MVIEKKDSYKGSGKSKTWYNWNYQMSQYQQPLQMTMMMISWGKVGRHLMHVHEGCCTCGKWQDHKYPCQHAIAYLQKLRSLTLAEILNKHLHPYYKMMSMKEVYEEKEAG